MLLLSLTAAAAGKGCTAVKPAQCGTDYDHSCLKCGTSASYDCEKCCPGCTPIVKPPFRYCECKGPKPPPGPPPGNDTWAHYSVAGLDVISVTGGKNESYDKVVIMLHGGGETGAMWQFNYGEGWFGNLNGLKYVFPTSAIASHVWFETYKKPGCGLADDCAYDLASIEESANRVAELVAHERALVGGDAKKVTIAGFSEGAQVRREGSHPAGIATSPAHAHFGSSRFLPRLCAAHGLPAAGQA